MHQKQNSAGFLSAKTPYLITSFDLLQYKKEKTLS